MKTLNWDSNLRTHLSEPRVRPHAYVQLTRTRLCWSSFQQLEPWIAMKSLQPSGHCTTWPQNPLIRHKQRQDELGWSQRLLLEAELSEHVYPTLPHVCSWTCAGKNQTAGAHFYGASCSLLNRPPQSCPRPRKKSMDEEMKLSSQTRLGSFLLVAGRKSASTLSALSMSKNIVCALKKKGKKWAQTQIWCFWQSAEQFCFNLNVRNKSEKTPSPSGEAVTSVLF